MPGKKKRNQKKAKIAAADPGPQPLDEPTKIRVELGFATTPDGPDVIKAFSLQIPYDQIDKIPPGQKLEVPLVEVEPGQQIEIKPNRSLKLIELNNEELIALQNLYNSDGVLQVPLIRPDHSGEVNATIPKDQPPAGPPSLVDNTTPEEQPPARPLPPVRRRRHGLIPPRNIYRGQPHPAPLPPGELLPPGPHQDVPPSPLPSRQGPVACEGLRLALQVRDRLNGWSESVWDTLGLADTYCQEHPEAGTSPIYLAEAEEACYASEVQ